MTNQNELEIEYIDELIRLKKENPDARIMCMVAYEELESDWHRTVADINKPTLDNFTVWHDEIINDEDYIKEQIAENICGDKVATEGLSDKEIDKKIDHAYQLVEWETGIFLNVG
jgi:Trk K+ transport system NAD-binding subunit